jgi:hypothetical protein
MTPIYLRLQRLICVAFVCLTFQLFAVAADEPTLTNEQIKQFLLTAKVVHSQDAKKGITNTKRLTLSDGTITHDASFQSIDQHASQKQLASGTELNFVDSWKYNIAAYELSELLGIDDMLPVYVKRNWAGQEGSLSWWLPVKMDEVERHKQKLEPPNPDAWNNQMYKIRVFDQLIYDSDPNLTNVLIGENWQIWRIDFGRAFRLTTDLKDPSKNLVRCNRQLFEKLKALDANVVTEKTKPYLSKNEIKSLMVRRDKIVAWFQKLIAEKGESEVLY